MLAGVDGIGPQPCPCRQEQDEQDIACRTLQRCRAVSPDGPDIQNKQPSS